MKRFVLAVLSAVLLLSAIPALSAGAVEAAHPDWLFTEIGGDTYGDAANPKNLNPYYNADSGNASRDVFEFYELYNNSGRTLNIYDYCLTYNGGNSGTADFENVITEITPVKPGSGWLDGWEASRFWTGSAKMPENPAYAAGEIAAGECVVLWSYYYESHMLNCTLEQFRTFWSIPDDVKVFLFDGNSSTSGSCVTVNGDTVSRNGHDKNFNIKNSATGSYGIAKCTAALESGANTAGSTVSQNYVTGSDIISWAVMDFVNVLPAPGDANNTVSFKYSETAANSGYSSSGGKRCEYFAFNSYENATVGRLTDEQLLSLPEISVYLEAGESYSLPASVMSFTLTMPSGGSSTVWGNLFTAGAAGVYGFVAGDANRFRMNVGASVRINDGTGIRFTAEIPKSLYDGIAADSAVASVERGTLIAPAEYFEKAGDFTAEALAAAGLRSLDVVAGGWYGTGTDSYTLAGSVVSILEKNYLLEYVGVAYIRIGYKDGTASVLYADFDGNENRRSPYEVALAARADGSTDALPYLDGVADVRMTGKASCEIRPASETLAGIDRSDLSYTLPYSCRCDGNLNVWIMSSDGRNPALVYVDGKLVAEKSGNAYAVTDLAFSASNETGGALISLKYTSPFEGIVAGMATKKDTGGQFNVLSDVSVKLTKVYERAGHTYDGNYYYILQSCCTDGKYIYYIMNKSGNLVNTLVKADLETGETVKEIYASDFDHGNGITYNVRTNELIIVHNDGGAAVEDNKMWISVVDADTLAVKEVRKLADKLYSCEYLAQYNRYAFGIAGTYNFRDYSPTFAAGTLHKFSSTGLTKQDMTADCDYIVFPQYTGINGTNYSYLWVISSENNTALGLIDLGANGGTIYEIEDCFEIAGQLYCAYYASGFGFRLYRADITIG